MLHERDGQGEPDQRNGHDRRGREGAGRHFQDPRRGRPGHLRPGERRRAHAGGAAGRRPRAAGRRAGPCQDQAGRDAGHRARPRFAPHPVHARPDAVRHSRLRGDGAGRDRQALLPLHLRADLRAAADGRRDQPRLAAHPVGAAAGDAGVPRHHRRRPPRSARALPCAGDAEPAGAGRHLSAARSPARPLPDAGRHPLSRNRGRAPHPAGNHRHRGRQGRRTCCSRRG